MFYTGKPEFPFGAGLSYTEWGVDWHADSRAANLVFSLSDVGTGATPTELKVEVSNTGGVAGRQTLLMFWRPKPTAKTNLRQKLVGYRGTGDILAPGQTKTLNFAVGVDMLAMVPEGTTTGDKVVALGEYELFLSDGTSTDKLRRSLQVVA